MNYRHHFHAGNYADVIKHAVLTILIRGMQRKEKGFLYLDTHAGRGGYDLQEEARGDSLERKPEWPEGIGRLWSKTDLKGALLDYCSLVRSYDAQKRGGRIAPPVAVPASAGTEAREIPSLCFYPGSPWIALKLARPQDRLALCEKHPEEFAALKKGLGGMSGVKVQELDGYTALRAMLPPPERRALVLIDPPYEEQDEFAKIVSSLREGLARLPGGTFAVWYPLTERARLDDFFDELSGLRLPPTWTAELEVADTFSGMRMNGCGLLVINPPWQTDREILPVLEDLRPLLAQARGASSKLRWLVPE
jgi:23S rRNA (adenine2030-N6)-methyltransferase